MVVNECVKGKKTEHLRVCGAYSVKVQHATFDFTLKQQQAV